MGDLIQDLRFAARLLARTPGTTIIALLTLALGIGANTAIFSVVKGVLLASLPFREARSLVFLTESNEPQFPTMSVAYPNFLDWRERQRSFTHLAAHRNETFNITGLDRPQQVEVFQVSASLFPMLGVSASLGRTFSEDEDQPGGPAVLVLSWSFWQERLGGDREILGRPLQLDGKTWEIVGVMPRGFAYPLDSPMTQMWLPIGHFADDFVNRGSHPGIRATARLSPGVSVKQAREDLAAIAAALVEEYPDTNSGNGITLTPLQERLTRNLEPALVVLTFAVALVLLIACVNVANLLLVRAASRAQEMAIRAALGAGRRRLVRQLLTESVLLAAGGGLLGLIFALLGLPLFLSHLDSDALPRWADVSLDLSVMGFTFAVAVATGVLFGLAPSLAVSRGKLADQLRDGTRTSTAAAGRHLRNALVVAEVAFALVLLTAALLFFDSFRQLTSVDPGFDPDNVLTFLVVLPEVAYPEARQQSDFFEALVERLEALPGVTSAAATLPLLGGWQSTISVEGQPLPEPGKQLSPEVLRVTESYFETLGMQLARGRLLNAADREDSRPVALIDETFAARVWPGEDPIGKRFTFGRPDAEESPENPWLEVVGIVNHIKSYGVDQDSRPQCYLPSRQSQLPFSRLVIKTEVDPRTLEKSVEEAVLELDPNQPIAEVMALEERLAQRLAPQRLATILLTLFAGLAILLAGIGIYGVMAYTVAQRRQEIGIRMAFGAGARDVLQLVVGRGLRLTLTGVAVGIGLTLLATPLVADQLFQTDPHDPGKLLAVAGFLALLALVACALPARRAAAVHPIVALRHE